MRRLAALLAIAVSAGWASPERDFSGNWILVEDLSRTKGLTDPEPFLKVTQDASAIHCSGPDMSWVYYLDGRDSKQAAAGEQRNSAVKWEGAALLVNTLVSGATNYTIMDRWRLSSDRNLLTITRQIVRSAGEAKATPSICGPSFRLPRPGESSSRPEAPFWGRSPRPRTRKGRTPCTSVSTP